MNTDESVTALLDSLEQDDARVRLEVVRSIAELYRPEVRQRLMAIVSEEANPAIVAAAAEGLAKYQDEATLAQLRKLLSRPSFRHSIANAAVRAIRSQDDPAAVDELRKLVDDHAKDFESRDLGGVLETVGHLARRSKEKSSVRDWLASHLQHPKTAVRMGAVRGLGSLRDRRAAPILRAFANDDEGDRLGRLATEELRNLDQQAQFVPQEIRELREQVRDLETEVAKVNGELKSLKSKLRTRHGNPRDDGSPAPKQPEKVAKLPTEV
jgi:HEAT repeat protein